MPAGKFSSTQHINNLFSFRQSCLAAFFLSDSKAALNLFLNSFKIKE
jgi:hypothetical protein